MFYFSLTASILSLATLPFGWVGPHARARPRCWSRAGLLGGVGQILLTESYRHAETSVIAPFEYVSMMLALILGYIVFEEIPTATHAGRRRDDRGRRPVHHLARAPAGAGAGQGAQGDNAAGMSMIYKIFRAAEMAAFVAAGETAGAPVDVADGYVHFSTAAQAEGTLRKHFAGEDGLWLLACDPDALGPALRWEPSRGGALFPHLYRAAHPRRRRLGAAAGSADGAAPAGRSGVSAAERLALRGPARARSRDRARAGAEGAAARAGAARAGRSPRRGSR